MSALTEDQLDALWELGQMALRAQLRVEAEPLARSSAQIYEDQGPKWIEKYVAAYMDVVSLRLMKTYGSEPLD